MLNVLIMCGGKGTRLWPKSINEKPKQFQKILDNKTMLQHTYGRMLNFVNKENIYFSTNKEYIEIIKEQIPNINNSNIIVEPCSKNTSPSILLSTLYIKNKLKRDFNLFVVPSDHLILDEKEFLKTLNVANIEINNDYHKIVAFGIVPNRIETGYGYINTNLIAKNKCIVKSNKFVEKPNYRLAKKYYKSRKYLWNSGMYFFNSKNILSEFEKFDNHNYKIIKKIFDNKIQDYSELYNNCDNISIDYAIMEKSNNIYVLPVDFGWDDLGTWNALKRYLFKDKYRNYMFGEVTFINSFNNFVYNDVNEKNEVVINDLENIYCINCNGKIIIGKINNLSKIQSKKEK